MFLFSGITRRFLFAPAVFFAIAIPNIANAWFVPYRPNGSYVLSEYSGPNGSPTSAIGWMYGPGYYPWAPYTRTFNGMLSYCQSRAGGSSSEGCTFTGSSGCYVVEPHSEDPGQFHPEFFNWIPLPTHEIPFIRQMGHWLCGNTPHISIAEYSWANPEICESGQTRDSNTGECLDPTPPEPPADENQGNDDPNDGGPETSDPSLDPLPQINPPSAACEFGNPCKPATGLKFQQEVDYRDPKAKLSVIRSYNSTSRSDVGLGVGWSLSFGARLQILGGNQLAVERPNGRGETFTKSNTGSWQGEPDSKLVLIEDATGFTLTRQNSTAERYDSQGRLLQTIATNGQTTHYTYDGNGRLATVTGPFGDTLTFAYDASGRLASITTPSAETYRYAYANGNLVAVTYPDGTVRQYHYENGQFPSALTGITDENGNRFATFGYDSNGKANLTQHAVTTNGIPQERFTFSYDSGTQTTVTDAAGSAQVLTFDTRLGVKHLIRKAHGDGKTLTRIFDDRNNLIQETDEEGRITTYAYSPTNQLLSRTEAAGTAAARTTNFQYLGDTNLPVVIDTPSVYAGSKKQAMLSYNGRLPIQIAQSGYTPSGAPVYRALQLQYNSHGQLIHVDGPRTDVADITTLQYYDCSTGGACGQLKAIINALGHTTTYDSYDANGRLLATTDPNGRQTRYAYDARGRVTRIEESVPGTDLRVTRLSYDNVGQVIESVDASGMRLIYAYDAAHYLRSITDALGNRVSYSYDAKGNRTAQLTYDPDGTLIRSLQTAYDLRNHVQAINRGGSMTQQVVDALGNLAQQTDPNQVASNSGVSTQHTYDALNRLIQTLDNLGGTTAYGHNPHDRLTAVTAPNGAVTQYIYDDVGNLLQETSPDRGVTTYTRDSSGNVTTQTDARGITIGHRYDALNRIIAIDYPTDTDIVYTYDAGANCTNGVGRLCEVTDSSGTTQYGYDAFGNVRVQVKTELGVRYATHYAYDAGNRITSITYPDNRVVSYERDTLGRITAISATVNGAIVPIATNRTYRADGLLLTQTYGNRLNEVRSYDQRGQLTYQSLGSADTRVYGYDLNGNLTQKQSLPEVGNYVYDALDRLTDETASEAGHNAYTYDPNGNRMSDLTKHGGLRTYTYATGTNRLVGRGNQTLVLDAAGNTVSDQDGKRRLAYDDAGRLVTVKRGGSVRGVYTYNYLNQRTRKVGRGHQSVIYHYDWNGRLVAETDTDGRLRQAYVWSDDEPLAQIRVRGRNDNFVYLHTDHLGTPRLATDATQTVTWRWEADAFGETKPEGGDEGGEINYDRDEDEDEVTVNLRFAGQYYDSESGLFYNWNRYYDPKNGRYITSDPVGLRSGLNMYAFVLNNPLRWVDPAGLFSVSVEAYLGVGGGINISYSGGALEFTGRLGVGLGGGAAYDPKGTPSPHAKKCGSGHIARTSLNLQAGIGAGPFGVGGSFTAASGNAVTTKVGGGYSSVSVTELSLDNSKGFGARLGGSVGVDVGSYSNWGDQQCGCP